MTGVGEDRMGLCKRSARVQGRKSCVRERWAGRERGGGRLDVVRGRTSGGNGGTGERMGRLVDALLCVGMLCRMMGMMGGREGGREGE